MLRLHPPQHPVTLHLDGRAVVAERGEPAAVALLAAGHAALARSPKFHRPRGPACLRAACDGCLARVDGVPNVMTCRVAARDGLRIDTQNVVGSRETDLFRMADWFFPQGMNHHELFAGVPGLQRVMQAFARRVAGLGKLPDQAGGQGDGALVAPLPAAARREADVLIVGAGAAGMSAALELASKGRTVEVIDDALHWGGSVRALTGTDAEPWTPLLETFGRAAGSGKVAIRVQTTAAGIYGDDVLVAGEAGVEVVTARSLVLAPGAHDGVIAFEGNDVPGVMSARAAGWLLACGVRAGRRVVVAQVGGAAPFGEAYARAVPETVLRRGAPVRVSGSTRVKGVTIATTAGERSLPCDALLVDAPRAPAYELCAQAGARLTHGADGYTVATGPGGCIRQGVFALGEVTGAPLEPAAMARAAAALADAC
jgi:sarcosine oxidase subunit alpha